MGITVPREILKIVPWSKSKLVWPISWWWNSHNGQYLTDPGLMSWPKFHDWYKTIHLLNSTSVFRASLGLLISLHACIWTIKLCNTAFKVEVHWLSDWLCPNIWVIIPQRCNAPPLQKKSYPLWLDMLSSENCTRWNFKIIRSVQLYIQVCYHAQRISFLGLDSPLKLVI